MYRKQELLASTFHSIPLFGQSPQAIADFCDELGFLKPSAAPHGTYLTTILYLGSSVIGTLHHLYFPGTLVFISLCHGNGGFGVGSGSFNPSFEVVKSLNISQYCGSFGEKNFWSLPSL